MQAGLDHHLTDLRTTLLKGTYCPEPVKRIYIPKANGKLRPLGIPTLTDRIVQRAMLMAMEPIWESDFHRLSYGFRPERSVHHAVRTVKIQLQDGADTTRGRWIIEGDLASYFDTVHQIHLTTAPNLFKQTGPPLEITPPPHPETKQPRRSLNGQSPVYSLPSLTFLNFGADLRLYNNDLCRKPCESTSANLRIYQTQRRVMPEIGKTPYAT